MAYNIDYDSYDSFSVYFNILKVKYQHLDDIVTSRNFVCMGDNVNVFINLETIFRYITAIKSLEEKILLKSDFSELIISNIVNLAAHYKKFFTNNGCTTNVFLYFTDFNSVTFPENEFTQEYRSFYHNKYTSNPKYAKFTETLQSEIFPSVIEIFKSVEGVYLVKGENMEGSIIPYAISEDERYKDYKNIVISSDLYETQYSYLDNFMNLSIVRNKERGVSWISDQYSIIERLFSNQKDYDIKDINKVFSHKNAYTLLICIAKDKYRSMDGVGGLGPIGVYKKLRYIDNLDKDIDELIKSFLGEDVRKNITNCYNTISLGKAYKRLTTWNIDTIFSYITDDIKDGNKLEYYNNTRFYNHKLMVEALTLGCSNTIK